MPKYDDLNAALDAANEVTNAGAAWVQSILDDIARTATDGLNAGQTANIEARLGTLVTNLRSAFQTPTAPVPELPAAPSMPGPFIVA